MTAGFARTAERARLAWRRSPLPAFLCWWGAELTAMLPRGLRDWVQRGPDELWLSAGAGGMTVRRARTGAVLATIAPDLPKDVQRAAFADACAGIDPDDRRLLLVAPTSQVLHRRLVLPAAAAADPRRVAGYELDRQTPFKAEQLYYDVRVSTDPAPAGQVALDLYAVPRGDLDLVLERFAALDVHPDAVDAHAAGGGLAGIDLLPPAQRRRHAGGRRRLNAALAAACVLLAVLALSQWLGNRRAALARMQDEVQAMRVRAEASERLQAQLNGALAASKFLVRRKSENPSALTVLDDVTRRVPSTAWLNSLTLDNSGGLDIQGEAARAAALVDALGDSNVLRQPKLQGIIQPDPSTGKERFELVAQVHRRGSQDAH